MSDLMPRGGKLSNITNERRRSLTMAWWVFLIVAVSLLSLIKMCQLASLSPLSLCSRRLEESENEEGECVKTGSSSVAGA